MVERARWSGFQNISARLRNIAATSHYQALFHRLAGVLHTESDLAVPDEKAMFAGGAAGKQAHTEWLDVDAAVRRYCAQHKVA